MTNQSWKVAVDTGEGHPSYNALRFPSEKQAQEYGLDLQMRWTMVRETAVEPSEDEPTHTYIDYQLRRIENGNPSEFRRVSESIEHYANDRRSESELVMAKTNTRRQMEQMQEESHAAPGEQCHDASPPSASVSGVDPTTP